MSRLAFALSVLVPSVLAVSQPAAAGQGAFYTTDGAAQASCPNDEVVWLDLDAARYYHKTQASYGAKGGAYACIRVAQAKSYREAKQPVQETAK
jgi:hypothetical protein